MSKRHLAVIGLALSGAAQACSNAGLLSEDTAGRAGATAQQQGGSGGAGAAGAPDQGGSAGAAGSASEAGAGGASAGSSGSAGTGSDSAGAGGSGAVACPPDDGAAAALTLAGLGLELAPSSLASDAGVDGGADAGTADLPPEFEGLALPGLLGWATQPAFGTATTIGGAAGSIVTAQTAEELVDFASRPEPLVIRICGVLNTPELRVSSHKTLLGVGPNATLEGGIRVGGEAGYVRNVVIKNLRVNAATSSVEEEAVRLERAHHVWIDHCELFDSGGEGALDIVNGSDRVTVSWSKFHFTPNTPDPEHRFGVRVGDHNQDPAVQAEDTGLLNVTLHHIWWADVRQRAPRVIFGKVHVFDSYYAPTTELEEYSVRASTESRVRLENNYFHQVTNPLTNPHELDPNGVGAQLEAIGNIYDGATGLMQATGASFSPPYAYSLDGTLGVPQQVMAGAGPR
jgi:pectate lyase